MSRQPSFKEYLEYSKNQLREALNKTPQCVNQYTVQRYCKLPVGETKDQKQYIPLKPNQKIVVEWLYTDYDNPSVNKIQLEGVKNVDPEQHYSTSWNGKRLQQWLSRNTNHN